MFCSFLQWQITYVASIYPEFIGIILVGVMGKRNLNLGSQVTLSSIVIFLLFLFEALNFLWIKFCLCLMASFSDVSTHCYSMCVLFFICIVNWKICCILTCMSHFFWYFGYSVYKCFGSNNFPVMIFFLSTQNKEHSLLLYASKWFWGRWLFCRKILFEKYQIMYFFEFKL